jgi:flagellar basal body P-ring protein FlgI
LGALFTVLAGCLSPQTRMQMAEDAEVKKDLAVKTIGDIADIRGVGPVQVSGIGVVAGLDGTGGTPQGPYRQILEQALRKEKIEHVKEILDSPDNAMVLITAFIPPGARRGDRLDVEIVLPPGSKATSLAGGVLQMCMMRNHDSVKSLLPDYDGPDRALQGHVMAFAKGPVMVGLGNGTSAGELKKGLVWRGAVCLIDLPYYLVLKKDDKSYRVAHAVEERLNFLFQEDPQRLARLSQQARQSYVLEDMAQQLNHKFDQNSTSGAQIAKTQSKETVQMRVPCGYRFNPERYMYVAHLVPLLGDAEQLGRYRRRLEMLAADPAETVMAVRRLEAMGRESIPALRRGLEHEHPLVRFASAEALAYLGDSSGIDELSRLAPRHPLLAGGCLTALASLDEPASRQRLNDLLNDEDPTLRSTAFALLRQLAERDLPEPQMKTAWGAPYREYLVKTLGGELLNDSFWLHHVAPKSARLVSFAADTRAEVVLFGDAIALSGPVRTLIGAGQEYALTFEPGNDQCIVKRISVQTGPRQKLCPPTLEDIIRTMADLGAEYSDVVDLIRKLDQRQCINASIRLYNAPPEVTPQMLVDAQRDGTLLRDDPREVEHKALATAVKR